MMCIVDCAALPPINVELCAADASSREAIHREWDKVKEFYGINRELCFYKVMGVFLCVVCLLFVISTILEFSRSEMRTWSRTKIITPWFNSAVIGLMGAGFFYLFFKYKKEYGGIYRARLEAFTKNAFYECEISPLAKSTIAQVIATLPSPPAFLEQGQREIDHLKERLEQSQRTERVLRGIERRLQEN